MSDALLEALPSFAVIVTDETCVTGFVTMSKVCCAAPAGIKIVELAIVAFTLLVVTDTVTPFCGAGAVSVRRAPILSPPATLVESTWSEFRLDAAEAESAAAFAGEPPARQYAVAASAAIPCIVFADRKYFIAITPFSKSVYRKSIRYWPAVETAPRKNSMCPSGHSRDAKSVLLESAKADIGYFLAMPPSGYPVAGRFPLHALTVRDRSPRRCARNA
jgi:hypothetical protein